MPHRVCPKCQSAARYLPATSESADVDYYRCDNCGHVWIIDKFGGRRDVTRPREKPKPDKLRYA